MLALGRPKEEDHPVFIVNELQREVEVNLNCRINLIRKKREKKERGKKGGKEEKRKGETEENVCSTNGLKFYMYVKTIS